MEINYRLLDAGSDTEIQQWLDLYRLSFHDTMSREYWHWIFENNPFYLKTRPLIFIAEKNRRIIGSRSVIPSRIQVNMCQNHSILNLGYLYGAMVHPDMRNQGIASSLLKNAINLTKDEGYDLLTSFATNLYAYKSLIKAGFTCLNSSKKSKGYLSVHGLVKNYLPFIPQSFDNTIGFPLSKIFTGIFTQKFPKISHNFRIQCGEVIEYTGEINRIHALNYSHSGVHGIRTPLFIKWRFSAPGIHTKCLTLWDGDVMLAYLILDYPDSGKNFLIEDLFVREGNEYLISILVSEAVTLLKKVNGDSVWTYLIDGKRFHSPIFSKKNGFISYTSRETSPMSSMERFLFFLLNENQYPWIFSDKKQWNIWCADFCFFEISDY